MRSGESEMKKLLCMMVFVGLVGNLFAGDKLIVTKEGMCFWVTSVTQEGDVLKYNSKQTGEEKTIAISKLHGVVPVVVRGKRYTPGEIQKYITRIKKLQEKHKRLYRQLQTILQGWEALQKPNLELEGDIEKLKVFFASSDKRTSIYKKTVLDLGMVRYKDMQGKYGPKLDNVLADMKADYVKVNKERLEKQAATAATMSFEAFAVHEQLTKDVLKEAQESDKTAVSSMLLTTRQTVFDAQGRVALKVFLGKKSIDAFLQSARIMYGLKENVAATEKQKADIDKRIGQLFVQTQKYNASYHINEGGFPIGADTRKLQDAAMYRCSTSESTYADLREEVFIIPEKSTTGLRYGRTFSFPLRMVIQRAQPKDRKFAFIVTYPGADTVTRVIGSPQFKNGFASVKFDENFAGLAGTQILPNEEGRYYFYFHMAYEVPQKKGDSTWQAVSKLCFWSIAP